MTQTADLYYPTISEIAWTEGNQWQGKDGWARVVIEGDDYERCANAEMWSSKKKGNYGQGLGNSQDDPRKVERTGRLGEMALAKLCGLGVDFNYREYGDNFDFLLMGLRIDVKTATFNQGYGLIYAQAPGGSEIKLKCDRYIFAHIEKDERSQHCATVVIAGYIKKAALTNRPLIPGWRGGGHKNHLIYYHELEPISKIVTATRKDVKVL